MGRRRRGALSRPPQPETAECSGLPSSSPSPPLGRAVGCPVKGTPCRPVGRWLLQLRKLPPSPCRHHFDEDLAKKSRLAAAVRDACLGLTGSYAWRRLLKVRELAQSASGKRTRFASGVCLRCRHNELAASWALGVRQPRVAACMRRGACLAAGAMGNCVVLGVDVVIPGGLPCPPHATPKPLALFGLLLCSKCWTIEYNGFTGYHFLKL